MLSPTRFSTAAQRTEALACLAGDPWAQPERAVAAVWHLRQTHGALAETAALQGLGRVASAGIPLPAHQPARQPAHLCARLHLTLAEGHGLRGRLDLAAQVQQQALAMFQRAGDAVGCSDSLWLQATLASDQGDAAGRQAAMQQALTWAQQAGDHERSLSCELALACFESFNAGGRALDAARALAQAHLASPLPGVATLAHLVMCHEAMGRAHYADAIAQAQAAVELAHASGQVRRALMDSTNLASLWIDLGDVQTGLAVLEPALALAREAGWSPVLGSCLVTMGHAQLQLGRTQAALSVAEEAAALLQAFAGSKSHLNALHLWAEATQACGDLDAARLRFAHVAQAAASREALELRRHATLGVARVDLAAGRLDAALAAGEDALQQARHSCDGVLEVDALHLLARVHLRRGEAAASAASNSNSSRNSSSNGSNREAAASASAPPGDTAQGLALLRQAMALAAQHHSESHAAELLQDLACALEQAGELGLALQAMKQAQRASASDRARAAARQAVALEIRFKTERALAEAQAQRQAAEMESRRAAELQALNERLGQTLAALQQAQAELVQRNQELQSAYARISDLSLTDPLTGLRNRRHLAQAMPAAAAACLLSHRRAAQPGSAARPGDPQDISFFLMDLDRFKRINDERGHAAGDAVLVQAAQRLRSVTRAQDDLVRWGGEEFLVVMRGLPRGEAAAMAERLRRAIDAAAFDLSAPPATPGDLHDATTAAQPGPHAGGGPAHVTASVGWAVFPQDPAHPEQADWEAAVKAADTHMYRAKQAGGNRCSGPEAG